MQRAQLKERVSFYEPRSNRTEFGAVETTYEKVWECGAYAVRFSNTTDKDRTDAAEAFFGSFGVIRTHDYPQIKDNQRVMMRGVMYQIILITPPRAADRMIEINITKINE